EEKIFLAPILVIFLIPILFLIKNEQKLKVGIIDSGLNENQEKYVYKFKNFVKGESNRDYYNHGTIIINIIRENTKTNFNLYVAKSMNKNGISKKRDFINAFKWMINNNVNIINISQGMKYNSKEIAFLIKKAEQKNILVIAASGNNYLKETDYPAKYPGVISIGTINKNGLIHKYSGEGKIDYVALGVNLKARNKDGKIKSFTGNSYATAYATSMVIDIVNNEKLDKKILEEYSINPYHQKNIYGKGVLTNEKTNE
ncbi:TPA: S8 family serine peptidase, partial [Staphylococcus aureus]|nr:S8 family serine peptidase [Staphylococcus aureus]HDG8588208.1 S8 family serine peptidase [Staphylococcus aureus]